MTSLLDPFRAQHNVPIKTNKFFPSPCCSKKSAMTACHTQCTDGDETTVLPRNIEIKPFTVFISN